jgi:PAS domain S-box-containing protein
MHGHDDPPPRPVAPHLARLGDYAVAVLATGAILFFELAFRSYLGAARFFPFTLAVLLAGRRGAWGPALLAIALSCVGVNVALTEPVWSPSLSGDGIFQTALFASVCLGLTALNVDLSRALTDLRTEQAERTAAANRARSARLAALASAQARRSAEAELRASEERFRLLVENVQDYAIFALDGAGNIQSWNQGAERIEGFAADEIIGRHVSTFYTEEDRAAGKPAALLDQAAQQGRAEAEGWRVRKDGSRFYAHVVVTALYDPAAASKRPGRLRGYAQVTRDMTAQREHEQAQREAMARLQGIFDTAADGIVTIDEAGAITATNQAITRLFGYAPGELMGRNVSVLMPAPYRAEHDSYLARYRGTGERRIIGVGREVQGLRKDGTLFPLELSVGETVLANGRIFTGIIRDITERRLAEDRLRASETRFRATFDQAAVGIAHVTLDGRWLRLNQRYCEILGYSPAEILGVGFQDVTYPEDLDADLESLQRLVRGEIGTYSMEKRYVRKDRTVVWVNLTVAMVRDGHGEPAYFISVVEDIDRKKRAETALRVLADVSAALGTAHGTGDTLAAVGRVVVPAMADACLVYLRTPEGVTPFALHHADPAKAERLRALHRDAPLPLDAPHGYPRVLRTGEPELVTEVTPAMLDALAPDPATRARFDDFAPRSWMVVPMKIHGAVIGALALGLDGSGPTRRFIREDLRSGEELAQRLAVALENARLYEELTTFNRQLEQRVEERTQRLGELNQELEAFSYSVSHDLRAPLRAIAGYCQILEEDHGPLLPASGHDAIRRARAATLRMGQLIDDMLELSRITRAEIRHERVNLSAIAEGIASELVEHMGARQVEVSIAPGMEVVGDERLLRVALRNLLGNAWKFTARRDPAHIEFGAEQRDGQRVFFVRDDGVGFDMKYAHRLFAPFQRLHAQSAFEGTGIGLATVRRVILKHGGHVWVDRAATGDGVTICFTLGETPA